MAEATVRVCDFVESARFGPCGKQTQERCLVCKKDICADHAAYIISASVSGRGDFSVTAIKFLVCSSANCKAQGAVLDVIAEQLPSIIRSAVQSCADNVLTAERLK